MNATYGPYSPFRQAGNLYFVSGQVGADPATKTAADIADQTKAALKNLDSVLATAGLTSKNVIKTTVFLTDMDDFAVMNEVYQRHFEAPRPARSCVAVAELPRVGSVALKVEIEAVAAKATS